MEELKIYKQADLPTILKWQILDFLRIEWPEGFQNKNRLRNWITNEEVHPASFVLVEEDIVISHVQVVWKLLTHEGITYKTYGLTGVFTYPQFRKQGYGKKVLLAATEYIRKSDADIALYNTNKETIHFYETGGWEAIYKAKTLIGDQANPKPADDIMLALFLSEKGRQGRKDFETKPFYFGEETW